MPEQEPQFVPGELSKLDKGGKDKGTTSAETAGRFELPWTEEERTQLSDLADKISAAKKAGDVEEFAKLTDQLDQILTQKQAERAAEEGEAKEAGTIEAKTPEGEPILFDMEKIKEEWRAFYNEHNLSEMAQHLPDKINLTAEQIERIQALAETEGFNKFIILPENPQQYLEKIKQGTEAELSGLKTDQQYSKEGTYLSDTVKPNFPDNITTLNRPQSKPYLLFLKDSPEVPEETLNKSADALRKEFEEKNLTGLTLQEYLLFQRDYTENHQTDANPHPDTKKWGWLLDSEVPGRVLLSDWYSDDRQAGVGSGTPDDHGSGRGARSSAIFPL